mmetsp:Transcript_11222/g.33825  ORF Transcript_11222/g.33825 Transcript_11222/m.33825 type:complete len:225 (-) Transcript_11222:273-947(-)
MPRMGWSKTGESSLPAPPSPRASASSWRRRPRSVWWTRLCTSASGSSDPTVSGGCTRTSGKTLCRWGMSGQTGWSMRTCKGDASSTSRFRGRTTPARTTSKAPTPCLAPDSLLVRRTNTSALTSSWRPASGLSTSACPSLPRTAGSTCRTLSLPCPCPMPSGNCGRSLTGARRRSSSFMRRWGGRRTRWTRATETSSWRRMIIQRRCRARWCTTFSCTISVTCS